METQNVRKTTVTTTAGTPAPAPTETVASKTVSTSETPANEFFVSKINQIVFAFVGIISVLLLLRFTFLLLGANQVGIVDFILALTEIFVAPFRGIFPAPSSGGSYFDTASIVAVVIYFVFAFIIGTIVNLLSSDTEKEL